MSSKKEEVAQAAADQIKVAALSAVKGLSHAQVELAAAAAARNVNAYGQKEEGPSRWQECKEEKCQMYLMSTETAVKLGVRKDLKSMAPSEGASQHCKKCFQPGHWTYECKNERVYNSHTFRRQQLRNSKLKMKISISYELDSLDNPQSALDLQHGLNGTQTSEKLETKSKSKGKNQKKNKRKRHSVDSSDTDSSEASVFSSDSGISTEVSGSELDTSESIASDSESDSCETSFDSDSEEEQSSKKHRKRGHQQFSSSDSESESDSDFGDCQRKRRQHRKRCHAR